MQINFFRGPETSFMTLIHFPNRRIFDWQHHPSIRIFLQQNFIFFISLVFLGHTWSSVVSIVRFLVGFFFYHLVGNVLTNGFQFGVLVFGNSRHFVNCYCYFPISYIITFSFSLSYSYSRINIYRNRYCTLRLDTVKN